MCQTPRSCKCPRHFLAAAERADQTHFFRRLDLWGEVCFHGVVFILRCAVCLLGDFNKCLQAGYVEVGEIGKMLHASVGCYFSEPLRPWPRPGNPPCVACSTTSSERWRSLGLSRANRSKQQSRSCACRSVHSRRTQCIGPGAQEALRDQSGLQLTECTHIAWPSSTRTHLGLGAHFRAQRRMSGSRQTKCWAPP
jgi:hypothetical protein